MTGIFFVLFHMIASISFCFGFVMFMIYVAKYMKKEMLFKLSLGAILLGFLLTILGLFVGRNDDAWRMMDNEYDGEAMMNQEIEAGESSEPTNPLAI